MKKRWQHLFEIFEPSLQEKQAMEVLRRIPGKPDNWRWALHYVMRRIPRQTRNRHYLLVHFKRPIDTIQYDGPGAINVMRVYKAVAYGVSEAKDRLMLDIINWPNNSQVPRGMGALEFSDLRTLVSTIEVVELPKTRIDSILGKGKPVIEPDTDDDDDDDDSPLDPREHVKRRLTKLRLSKGKRFLKSERFTRVLVKLEHTRRVPWGDVRVGDDTWIQVNEWDSDVDYVVWRHGGPDPKDSYNKYFILGYPSGFSTYWKMVEAQYDADATEKAEETWPDDFQEYNSNPDEYEYPIAQVSKIAEFKLARKVDDGDYDGDYELIDGTIVPMGDVH